MKKRNGLFSLALACVCLAACGAADENEAPVEDSDLGVVEQAIGEAACGTDTVPVSDILTVTSVINKIKDKSPPYGSATCTNAALIGVRVGTNKGLVTVSYTSAAPSVTDCAKAGLKAVYYKNGVQVASKTANGTIVAGRCKRPLLGFSAAEVGRPQAADNARFAVQATFDTTTLKNFRFELTGQN